MSPSDPRLLADIGGTNARFAWQAEDGAPLEAVRTLACAEYATLAQAAGHYLAVCERPRPQACAMAIANPVVGDAVAMTNHHWTFSIAALKAELGLAQLLVINDFTALALALPHLQPNELRQLGGTRPAAQAAIALIGPGTGLGVSGLLPDGAGGWVPLQGEGGHVTLAATTAREAAVLGVLARWHGHASAERAVSGQGLVDIHQALIDIDGGGSPADDAAAVTDRALAQGDARATEALALFCAFLGTTAGNLALTLGAKGGVFIGGGIVPRLGDFFQRSPFRARFDAKGRFAAYLAEIPVFTIHAAQSPALLGAAAALASRAPFAGRAG